MTRLEYCAPAEPRLLQLQACVVAGDNKLQVYETLKTLVGKTRFQTEYDAASTAKKVPPGRDPELFRVESWDKAHPQGDPIHRLTGGWCVRRTGEAGGCGCIICDLSRDIGVLDAVAEAEPKSKPANA